MISKRLLGATVLLGGMLALPIGAAPVAPEPVLVLVFDGHALREICADGYAYYSYGKCAGYIIGVHDQYALARGSDVDICLPLEDGSADGAIDPVVAYLDGHGDRLFEPASTLVLAALREAFPCNGG